MRMRSGRTFSENPDVYWLARTEPLPVQFLPGWQRRRSLDVAIPGAYLRQHLFVAGATGSGKSLAVIAPLLHQHIHKKQAGMLALSWKHDPPLFRRLLAWAREAGREQDVIYLSLRPEDAGLTAWWDPLSQIESVAVLADVVVSAIVEDQPQVRFFGAQNLDGLSVALEAARRHGEVLSWPRLAELLSETGKTGPGQALADYVRPWSDLTRRARSVQWENASDVKMMANRLSGFAACVPHPGRARLDLAEALRSGRIVIASLDAMAVPAAARYVGRMLVASLGAVLSGSGRTESAPLYLVILDEFGQMAGPHLVNLLSKARGFGVGLGLATQSLADLRTAGSREQAGGLLGQVIENVATSVILTLRDPQDARWWSEASGSVLRRYAFESILEEGAAMEGLGTVHSAQRESQRIHPNKLLYLPRLFGYVWIPSRRSCLWLPGGKRPAYPRAADVRDAVLCKFAIPPDPDLPDLSELLRGGRMVVDGEDVPPAEEEPVRSAPAVPSPGVSGALGSSWGVKRKTKRGRRAGRQVRERERLRELERALQSSGPEGEDGEGE